MFTGIIAGTGRIKEIRDSPDRSASRITVDLGSNARGLRSGESVAINGVCLTATEIRGDTVLVEVIRETLERTNIGVLAVGDEVNVERSLRADGRIEGHFVLGHVDGTGTIQSMRREPDQVVMTFDLPKSLSRLIVEKGSIAIDGISLTLASVDGATASVCLIPHTLMNTNLESKREGDKINIEADILGKYVLRTRELPS